MAAWRVGFLLAFASAALAQEPPTEFVTQILEPTGGKILRPKDWFYAERHSGSTYPWIPSREESNVSKPYITGVSTQVFPGVKAGTGKTAQQFMQEFLADRKHKAERVVRICLPHDAGAPVLGDSGGALSHALFGALGY